MELEEAIEKETKEARQHYDKALYCLNVYGDDTPGYTVHKKCGDEHLQIAEWLSELKERRGADDNSILKG